MMSFICSCRNKNQPKVIQRKILFHNGELNLLRVSLAGQWLPAAGGDGAWAARTGSGPMRMRGDIFAASRLWRDSLLMTGHLSSSHPVVVGAGDVSWGSLLWGGQRRGRAPGVAMPSACGFSAV
jgi:hypothetical protein